MALIEKRGPYSFRVKIRRKGYPQQTKTFDTQREAVAWARSIESEMDRGIFIDRTEAERTTFGEALERYRLDVTSLKKSASRENTRINFLLTQSFSSRTMASLRSSDFASFRDERRRQGLADSTIRLDLALISHLFEMARKEWGMESVQNPIKLITLPKQSRKRDRRLHGDEEARILAVLQKIRNRFAAPMVEFAIETAMRQSEIINLKWNQVDLKQQLAFLNKTKNGDSRIVPLSDRAVDIVESLPRQIHGGNIFRITQDGISRGFASAVRKARAMYEQECLTRILHKKGRNPYNCLI